MTPPAPSSPGSRRLRRGLLVGGIVVVALGLAGAVVVDVALTRRQEIGAQLVVRYLARHGVAARLRFTRLDARGFSARLSLGPPGRPDLEAVEARGTFAPGPAFGPVPARLPRLVALTLVQPHLRARWDGRRLSFGTLQPLIDEMAEAPKGGPAPAVDIQDGRLDLATPAGPVSLHGDARLRASRLRDAALTLDPATLDRSGARAEGLAAELHITPAGRALHVQGSVQAARLSGRGALARTVTASIQATVSPTLDGPVKAVLAASAQGAALRRVSVDAPAVRLQLSGVWTGPDRAYRGGLTGTFRAAAVSADAWRADIRQPFVTVRSPSLDATLAPQALAAAGPVTLAFGVGTARAGKVGWRLASAGGGAEGRLAYAGGRLGGALDVSLQARGGATPALAAELAGSAAPLAAPGGSPALAAALGRLTLDAPRLGLALDEGTLAITTPRPVEATAGGAQSVSLILRTPHRLTLQSGGAVQGDLRLVSGGRLTPHVELALDGLTANARTAAVRATLGLHGDAGPAHAVDFAWRGTVRRQGDALSLAASDCSAATVGAVRDAAGQDIVRDLRLRLCPNGAAPLLAIAGGETRIAATVEDLAATAPKAAVALGGGSVRLDLDWVRGAPTGRAVLQALALRDLSVPTRFAALRVSGQASAAQGDWQGEVELAPGGRPDLVEGRFAQARDGRGWLQAAAPALRFSQPGLQPADLSPLLSRYASQAQGPLAADLRLEWTRAGLGGSRLQLSTGGLDLRTPAGMVTGLAGTLVFQPLVPLASAGVQHLTAAGLQTPLPMSKLSVALALDPGALKIARASADVAGGSVRLDPMSVALTPGAALSPVVRLEGVQLGRVLDAFNLSKALSMQAAVSGVLPLSFGPGGVHVDDGRLHADGPGMLTLHRTALGGVAATAGPAAAPGAPPTAAPAPNAMQDLAFQALEHLAFTTLTAQVDSRAGGRLGVVLHVVGRHEPPKAPPPPRIALFDLLRGKAFDKDLPLPKGTPIDLTLDTSLNFDDLLAQYGRLDHAPAAGSGPVHP